MFRGRAHPAQCGLTRPVGERVHQSQGGLQIIAKDGAFLELACELVRELEQPPGIHGEFRALGDTQVYFKAEPLATWPRLRHGARHLFLRRPYPRLAEYENLRWLASRGFNVPEPLAAGVLRVWSGVAWQFLFTRRKLEARPLFEGGSALPDGVLGALANEVARLHELGFIHRDLHLRNLAWLEATDGPSILIFDAWRGGARWQSRGVAYDLACLLAGIEGAAGPLLAQEFLELYLAGRRVGTQGVAGLRAKILRERNRRQAP
ncbi:MAG: hypothetical protein ACI9F9_001066 [Candidatus Paceibacteria bacterium]|jgi:hypothetical protein